MGTISFLYYDFHHPDIETEIVAVVREAAGKDIVIIPDANHGLTTRTAIQGI